jgi:hypothetical protein
MLKAGKYILLKWSEEEPSPSTPLLISYSSVIDVDSIYLLDSEEKQLQLMFKRKVMQRIYTKQFLTLNLL